MKNIVVIGGKKGIANVLKGIKKYPVNITAIVNTFDSGGSSGILRREFSTLPFGDIRGALVSLAPNTKDSLLPHLFDFRFKKKGSLQEHSFGNIFLQALTSVLGNEIKAIQKASKILNIKGRVLPISLDNAHPHALLENGKVIKGEMNIDVPKHDGNIKIKKIYLQPMARIYKKSRDAILKADFIIIGPGDLYTSILPNVLVDGFSDAIKKTKAKIVYITNIMTKWGETNDFEASDFVNVLLKYLKKKKIDFIICNSKIPKISMIKKYAKAKAIPVVMDYDKLKKYAKKIIFQDVIFQFNIIKHHPEKLAKILINLL